VAGEATTPTIERHPSTPVPAMDVPAGVTAVIWNGARQPVQNGLVDLEW
jgi:hypothetical protein